ncbi:Tenascin-X [Trichinella sp. T9]|nr:Tenascin-X [Trichinella sp. T9]
MMVFLPVFLSILSVSDLAEASNGTFSVYSWCGDDYKCNLTNTTCELGVCICIPNFIVNDNGTACIPAPKLGEPCKALCATYNSFCIEETCKCMAGFKESDGECVQEMASIGEDCFSDNQCSSVYSRCSNGICTCKAGFKNVNGTCMPRYYKCNTQWPDGEGDNEVTPCEVNFAEGKHTCQEGLYCQYMEMKEDLNQPVKGICCNSTAKEASNTVYCPAGDFVEMELCTSHGSYYYYFDEIRQLGICCANSCSKERRENNGTCYFPVGVVGSACTIDAQCEINQVCKQNRCTCDVGFFEIGEQCLLPDCFFGEPLVDMTTGENVQCSQNHACSDGYYCVREYNICCKNIE